jgi:hypothetical protein
VIVISGSECEGSCIRDELEEEEIEGAILGKGIILEDSVERG